jgi:hypothetical protein
MTPLHSSDSHSTHRKVVKGRRGLVVKAAGWLSLDRQFEPYPRANTVAPSWCGLGCRSRTLMVEYISPWFQGTINNIRLQNMIQLCRGPTTARLCPLISFVGKSQLILQVFTNPLCQFVWKPKQDRMSSPVYVLQPLWRGMRSIR